jgi:cell division septation protein DedD/nucleoid DNA-binding protein
MKINVVKYIPELLYRHDCVIIPGFGGFIGNYSPAMINPVYHTFYPPFKSLLFNIHLKQNDGLLASCISQAEQIPYEHAMELIQMMLEDWNRELENGQELVIEKVGKIVKETDGIFQFEQDTSVNYLPDAFGLTTLVSPAIRRPGMQDKLEKKLDRYIHAPSGKSGKLTRTLKWAAVMALPVGLAVYLSLTNMDQIRSFHENYTGFLFSNSTSVVKKRVESPKILLPSKKSVNSVPKIAVAVQPSSAAPVKQVVKPEVRENSDPSAKKPYAIIVGAFRFRENADNLVAKLKQEGYDAGIFDTTTTGLFRVSVGTFVSRDEAIGQLAAVRSNNYSAWLLSK